MIAALAVALFAADEPRLLKYLFKAGDEVKYINTNTRRVTVKQGGKKGEVTLEQKTANLWKVRSVSPDGSAEVSQTVTRIRITTAGDPRLGVKTFDSTSEENAPALQSFFDDLTKSEIRFKMGPNGAVSDVALPPKLKERLNAKKEGETPLLTEQWFTGMVRGSVFNLPTKPVKPGDGWDIPPYTYQESGHWVTMNARITYEGPVEQEGKKLLKFSRTAEYQVKTPKDEQAAPEVNIKRQNAEGFVLLDATTCRLVESSMAESQTTETTAGVQKVETETVVNTTIKLKEPEKEKADQPPP